jgi:hypothetical protein
MVKHNKPYIVIILFLFLIVFLLFLSTEMASSQNIRLLSPNGGERWVIGEGKDITWNYWEFPTHEKVELVLFQKGKRIGTIGSHIPIAPQGGDITGPQGPAAKWTWKVGNHEGGTATVGSGYRIQIRTMSVGLKRIYYDQSDREFTLVEKVERPVLRKVPPDLKRVEPEKPPTATLLPDFKVKGVRYNYPQKKVIVYFDGGLGKYKGPLVFNVTVRNDLGDYFINRRNMVHRDNTIEDFALNLQWPSPHTPYLNVSVKINPDCQIKEFNCNNNLYEGRIFEDSTDFKLLSAESCYPTKKSIWWPKDSLWCDGNRIYFNEREVKVRIQRGELQYYDPYDPNVNVLLGKAKVWIGNFSPKEGTARVRFTYMAHDGARTAEHQGRLAPGARGFVESGIMLNLQRDNFIEVFVESRSSIERARINIRFDGLPYSLK